MPKTKKNYRKKKEQQRARMHAQRQNKDSKNEIDNETGHVTREDEHYDNEMADETGHVAREDENEIAVNSFEESGISINLHKYFEFESKQTKQKKTQKLDELMAQKNTKRRKYFSEYRRKQRAVVEKREVEQQRQTLTKRLKRKDENFKLAEKQRETLAKRMKRVESNYRKIDVEVESKRSKRKDENFKFFEKQRETPAKRCKRKDEDFKNAENQRETPAKRCKRKDEDFKNAEKQRETPAKREKRKDKNYKQTEKQRETPAKRWKRVDFNYRKINVEVESKRTKRKDEDFKHTEKQRETPAKRCKRKDEDFKHAENQRETPAKRCKRKDEDFKHAEKQRETPAKRCKRKDEDFKNAEKQRETPAKRWKRKDENFKHAEKERETPAKRIKRDDPNYRNIDVEVKSKRMKRSTELDIDALTAEFHKKIQNGPTYVCEVCHQLWFQHSVKKANRLMHLNDTAAACLEAGDTWICGTCEKYIKKDKIPPCSRMNGMNFPEAPHNMDLHPLEWRLLSPRIPFMKIYAAPRGKQKKIRGNVVNVPANVMHTARMLPRARDDTMTIAAQLRRQLKYKNAVMNEVVRPYKILEAARWLQENGKLYAKEGIMYDENWESYEEVNNDTEAHINIENQEVNNDTEAHINIENQEVNNDTEAQVNIENDPIRDSSDIEENDINVEINDDDDKGKKSDYAQKNSDDDDWTEDEGENASNSKDTMLTDQDFIENNEKEKIHVFAPGEGNIPMSVFTDKNSEELGFPNIFYGNERCVKDARKVNVFYSEICKSELRRDDRRAANCIDNIFFKLKKLQMKTVLGNVQIALRKNKTAGRKLTAGELKTPKIIDNLVHFDEGFMMLKTLRGSPPYFKKAKSDLFAMIRQLGPATFFCSFSAAETRWKHLLKILGKVQDKRDYSDEEIDAMDWETKCRLVASDPVTCVRQFDFQVNCLFNDVLKKDNSPIGKVVDFFYRVEFQQRGSPHIHALLYVKDSPIYGKNTCEEICDFIDKTMSCSKDVEDEELKQLLSYQVHKHSHTCKKPRSKTCRFGFPKPPMMKTQLLAPLDSTVSEKEIQRCKKNYSEMKLLMDEMIEGEDISFDEFLKKTGLTYDDYILAIRASINRAIVFLKRSPNELRINAYNINLMKIWKANHDIQYVLDVYACAMYIASYIAKSQRGISDILRKACEEVRKGNLGIREQMKILGNQFLNNVEISSQEAVYIILQLPMRKSSREVVFINTSPPDERVYLLKSSEQLAEMDDDDECVQSSNMILRYQKRPNKLEKITLAEFVAKYDKKNKFKKRTHHVEDETLIEDVLDNNSDEEQEEQDIKMRSTPRVIRYVNFNVDKDPEKHYRELLMLYTPWRDEEVDLIGDCETFAQKYALLKGKIAVLQQEYENNRTEVDEAIAAEDQDLEDAWDEQVPVAQQIQREDEEIEAAQIEILKKKKAPLKFEYDIGSDLGLSNQNKSDELTLYEMPDEEYRTLMRSLNDKQLRFVYDTLYLIKTSDKQVFRFLSGGAGVGKSFVTTALYQSLVRYYRSRAGDDYQTIRQLLLAPTGKAAYNIRGNTIHSALKVPANQGLEYKALDSGRLNTLRTNLGGVKVIFIDEVSMVGHGMFNFVNRRLQDIKGSGLLFGGIHIITIGDLFQLKPVFDGYVFESSSKGYGPIASNIWRDNFEMYELTEIMRQKDSKLFAELLNRFREGKYKNNTEKENDISLLQTRLLKKENSQYPYEVQHLFLSNAKTDAYNEKAFDKMTGQKFVINAKDSVVGSNAQAVGAALLANVPDDPRKTMHLHRRLQLVKGLKCELCLNVQTEDGLTNGATCTIKLVEVSKTNMAPGSIVWVQFEDQYIGSETRKNLKNLHNKNTEVSWTPIMPVSRQMRIGKFQSAELMRTQIPLRPSAAKTVHRSQGDTVDKVVVDFDGRKMEHVHYVGLSRVKTLEGLHILNLSQDKIQISQKVKTEMEELRNVRSIKFATEDCPSDSINKVVILYHNVRSLQKYIEDVKVHPATTRATMIILSETRLKKKNDDVYKISGYKLVRNDAFSEKCSNHHGMAVYIRCDFYEINQVKIKTCNNHGIEMIHIEFNFTLESNVQLCNIFGVYKPPKVTTNDLILAVKSVMNNIKDNAHSIVIGDLNIQVGSPDYRKLSKSLDGFKQQILKPTTDADTTIDLLYTNIPGDFLRSGTIENYYSDHKIIFCCLFNERIKEQDDKHCQYAENMTSNCSDAKVIPTKRRLPKVALKKNMTHNAEIPEIKLPATNVQKSPSRNEIALNTVVCRGFGYTITEADIYTLHGKQWLNDQIINFYLKMIERNEDNNDVKVLDTFTYIRITANLNEAIQHFKYLNLLHYGKILIPIHLRHHWSLIAVFPRSKTIKYYDSMRHFAAGQEVMSNIREFMKSLEEGNISSHWKTIYEKQCTIQRNGYDCGIHVCMNAEAIIKGSSLKLRLTEIEKKRFKISRQIRTFF